MVLNRRLCCNVPCGSVAMLLEENHGRAGMSEGREHDVVDGAHDGRVEGVEAPCSRLYSVTMQTATTCTATAR
jgi:hypothetical protein